MVISFTTPLPPSVNSYLKKRVSYTGGKAYVQVYESVEAKAFKRYVKKLVERIKKDQGSFEDYEGYLICEVVIYFTRRRSDADNIFKCLLDSFTESELIKDDSMVLPRVREFFVDKKNPRIEVNLYKSSKIGVFKDSFTKQYFYNNNCEGCNRNKRNCSIFKKLCTNEIVEEVDLKILKCFKTTRGTK